MVSAEEAGFFAEGKNRYDVRGSNHPHRCLLGGESMKRIRIAILAAVTVALLAFPGTAFAEHLAGKDWTVTFATDEQMHESYLEENQWHDEIRGLEPGDDITFNVTLKHEHPTTCDWYMANEVLKSLEEGVAEGSMYGYKLTYTSPSGESKTLYDSSIVGGDRTGGLLDATSALEDFFFLDALKQGETASVKLLVTLDGETEGNAYFDTLAQLKMKFAVELDEDVPNDNPPNPETPNRDNPPSPNKPNTPTTSTPNRTAVQTGDTNNLFPFYVAMAVSGAVLLGVGVVSVRRRNKEKAARQTGTHAK